MGWVLDMGNNGPNKGQGGKHLVLPQDYKGNVPAGCYVGQSGTWKDFFVIRAISPEGKKKDGAGAVPPHVWNAAVTWHREGNVI